MDIDFFKFREEEAKIARFKNIYYNSKNYKNVTNEILKNTLFWKQEQEYLEYLEWCKGRDD